MSLKIVKNNPYRILTRYDDIMKEIMEEKLKAALREYEKYSPPTTDGTTYKLGDVIGEKLNKII